MNIFFFVVVSFQVVTQTQFVLSATIPSVASALWGVCVCVFFLFFFLFFLSGLFLVIHFFCVRPWAYRVMYTYGAGVVETMA